MTSDDQFRQESQAEYAAMRAEVPLAAGPGEAQSGDLQPAGWRPNVGLVVVLLAIAFVLLITGELGGLVCYLLIVGYGAAIYMAGIGARSAPRTRAAAAPPEKQFGAPRRFGLGTILIVTAAFALFFAMLKGMGVPAPVIMFCGVFLAIVGVGQMLLFGGVDPRKASMVTGAVAGTLLNAAVLIYYDGLRHMVELVALLIFAPIGYAITGYLAGALVGGVFLLMEGVQTSLLKDRVAPRPAEEYDPFAPEEAQSPKEDAAG